MIEAALATGPPRPTPTQTVAIVAGLVLVQWVVWKVRGERPW